MTEDLAQRIAALKEFMAELHFPEHPRSDWDGTNHYEITDSNHKPENSYWWLDDDDLSQFGGQFGGSPGDASRTDWGRKIGLLMDGACLVPDLFREIEALQEKATFMPEQRKGRRMKEKSKAKYRCSGILECPNKRCVHYRAHTGSSCVEWSDGFSKPNQWCQCEHVDGSRVKVHCVRVKEDKK